MEAIFALEMGGLFSYRLESWKWGRKGRSGCYIYEAFCMGDLLVVRMELVRYLGEWKLARWVGEGE